MGKREDERIKWWEQAPGWAGLGRGRGHGHGLWLWLWLWLSSASGLSHRKQGTVNKLAWRSLYLHFTHFQGGGGRQRGHSRIFRAWVWIRGGGGCYIATTIVGWKLGACAHHTSHGPARAAAHLNNEGTGDSGNQSVNSIGTVLGEALKQGLLEKKARSRSSGFLACEGTSLALEERNERIAISVILLLSFLGTFAVLSCSCSCSCSCANPSALDPNNKNKQTEEKGIHNSRSIHGVLQIHNGGRCVGFT